MKKQVAVAIATVRASDFKHPTLEISNFS